MICSPNNPTGNVLERDALIAVLQNAKGIVLVDEAYHEFSGQTAVPLLADHPNLVVLRTFSKAMAMAGLRFGYMMAHPEIAREIYKSKLPYNVNIFTLAAAEIVIEKHDVLNRGITTLVRERDRVFAELQKRAERTRFPVEGQLYFVQNSQSSAPVVRGALQPGRTDTRRQRVSACLNAACAFRSELRRRTIGFS